MKLPQLKLPFFKKPKPPFQLNRKQTYWVIGGLAILAILAIAIGLKCQTSKQIKTANLNASAQPETPAAATTAATTTPPAAAKKAPVKTPALPYEEAIKKSAGWRIQFDAACQPSITSMTLKTGSAIMLDNRSSAKQIITIGDKKYTVNSFNFLIVSVTASPLPQTLNIACNARYNVARINVQP